MHLLPTRWQRQGLNCFHSFWIRHNAVLGHYVAQIAHLWSQEMAFGRAQSHIMGMQLSTHLVNDIQVLVYVIRENQQIIHILCDNINFVVLL